jgi:hypothetical protein
LVIYPDNVILRGVTTKDLPEVIEYLKGGPLPVRLVLSEGSPEEIERKSFYSSIWADSGVLPVVQFLERATAVGFDEAWVAEQLRRGFLAKKPTESGEVFQITKKARDRYSLSA